ncbi:MAG: virulence protein RhuM/Fic/DOC family protein [Rickettsia endosymbiont of Ixodes persulcatus]|nr:virulence protein RhuM/Fic/DOC family protein [Rickettsia endosymbiont of Ixodes persulcatus]MCZ6903449.1 virulence protein RhuM/Fic/DOC family protein [Rickettsia endosymbiont of Ixodes persulcatus]MCZ6908416.1 virulence protein RhuM/Fic/DOC family protein [Rickettsia endosymbiont of Ixodes persulcatus]MCZ6911018.1 virulence protein RhuM/Fic/DOC family protein [Rickettsia endosymbiont of Ixodes persulcatus]MCZ6913291.1 virulence protein RhuM/Fic/DOC family protein [Rickettsia endosymbiont o
MNKAIESQLVIYQSENGKINVEVKVSEETVWLSLTQVAEVFERDKSVISRHLKNIFKERELEEKAVVAKNATTASDGKTYQVEYYNLDAIISVGYRVNSKRAIAFRQWATNILKEYLIQGYSINQDKVMQNKIEHLKQTVEFLSNTLINQKLVNNIGQELVSLIRDYTKTWDILVKYDEDRLEPPAKLKLEGEELLSYQESVAAISVLKQELQEQQNTEISNLFGLERENNLEGILGNIDQTFDGNALYASVQEKAAHLLYFIIKDHPFSDGNKRIGSLLFLLYLIKAKIELKNIGVGAMTSLALLVAESRPAQKSIMILLAAELRGI